MDDRNYTTTGDVNAAGALNTDLQRLRDLHDYDVAEGYPDVRGWKVKTPDGRTLGKVHDLIVSVAELRARYLDVDLDDDFRRTMTGTADDDGHALIPIGTAQLDDAHDDVIVDGLGTDLTSYPRYSRTRGITRDYESSVRDRLVGDAGAAAAASTAAVGGTGAFAANDYAHDHYDEQRLYGNARDRGKLTDRTTGGERRLTLSEEQLDIGKQQVQAGEVGVRKTVETEHVSESVPLRREEVTIERHPLTGASATNAEIGAGESEIRVPVMREEAVVEKRTVPTEQIIVRKQAVSENRTVEADLRKERVDVDDATVRAAGGTVRDTVGETARDVRAGAANLGDRVADKIDDVKDRVDGNPASRPGPDATDRPGR